MRNAMRAVCPLASIVGVAAILTCYFRSPISEETESRMVPESVGQWHNAQTLGQDLEHRAKRVQRRSHAKDAVIAEVIAGRLTLFEAAARFRNLNATCAEAERWLSYQFRDQPYELALCRTVIHRVELELRSRASGPENGIVARLEAELAEHLQRHGRVCLAD